jgi:hypothetical protein
MMSFWLNRTRVTFICIKVMTLQAISKDINDDMDKKNLMFLLNHS